MSKNTTTKNHQKASKRKSRNCVESICDDHGEKFDDEEDIVIVFNNLFQDIFSTSHLERITKWRSNFANI